MKWRSAGQLAPIPLAAITPLRERWTVQVADGPDLEVKGNIVDHEYTIEDGCTKAAEVSKMWFRVADTYGVEVGPGQVPAGALGAMSRRRPRHARDDLSRPRAEQSPGQVTEGHRGGGQDQQRLHIRRGALHRVLQVS